MAIFEREISSKKSKNRFGAAKESTDREKHFFATKTPRSLSILPNPPITYTKQKHTHIAKADRRKKEPLVCYAAVGVVVVVVI